MGKWETCLSQHSSAEGRVSAQKPFDSAAAVARRASRAARSAAACLHAARHCLLPSPPSGSACKASLQDKKARDRVR